MLLRPRTQSTNTTTTPRMLRGRQVAGLLLLALLVLAATLVRAGTATLFPTGWWRF